MKASLSTLPISCLLAGAALAAPFNVNNLVISRIGDGSAALSGNAQAVFLDEYTTAGVAVGNSIAMPTAASGSNYTLTMSGTATSVGFLTRSVDGKYLSLFGVDAPVGTATPHSTSSFRGRTVGIIDYNGNVDTSTRFEAAGSTPRSAVTTNGIDIWTASDTGSGTTGGVRYTTKGTTAAGTLVTGAPTNTRVVNIANGQLYVSSQTGSFIGVSAVGTGLPTTSGQTTTLVAGGASNSGNADSAYDYYFADANTLYIADDDTTAPATRGLQKWTFDGSAWVKAWGTSDGVGLRSITGQVDGSGNVTLYAITSETTTRLVGFTDTLSNTTTPSTLVSLATSPTNTLFRGVEFAPTPEPTTILLLCGASLALVRRRRPC